MAIYHETHGQRVNTVLSLRFRHIAKSKLDAIGVSLVLKTNNL